MFGFITKGLEKIYATLSTKLRSLFTAKPDAQTLKAIETLLLEADTGMATTQLIMQRLNEAWSRGALTEGSQLHTALKDELLRLCSKQYNNQNVNVYLLVGINGSGKTTTAAKLAHYLHQQHKKVLLVAADTFRAAAVEQLQTWATRVQAPILVGAQGQDPAAVVFQGCQTYKDDNFDTLIIDTAGRLQTKVNLMKELEKIGKVIQRQLPDARVQTLLTIDAMLGQNSREQARLFHESTKLDGIILTKIDGTGKGGIIFSIQHELNIPVAYLSYGEQVEQFALFEPEKFVTTLLEL